MDEQKLRELEKNIKRSGEFSSPKIVSEFLASIVDVKDGSNILDPTCGIGGLLINIVRRNQNKKLSLTGVEINKEVLDFARYRLNKEGISVDLVYANFLLTSKDLIREEYNIIVADFPFGVRIRDKNILLQSKLGQTKPSEDFGVLLLEKCTNMLAEKGEIAVVVPEGFLFSSNQLDLRRFLVNKLVLTGVISLPHGIYSPYTNIKTSILLLENKKEHPDSVYFALAENIETEKNDLKEISEEIANFKKGEREFSKGFLVSYKELIGKTRWDAKMHTAELNIIDEIAQRLNYPIEILSDVASFHSGRRVKGEHEYPVVKGDVLFADKGTIGRPVLITKDKKVYKSKTHYQIIRPDENKVDSLYLYSYCTP